MAVFTGDDAPPSQWTFSSRRTDRSGCQRFEHRRGDQVIDAAGRPVTPALFRGSPRRPQRDWHGVWGPVDSRLNELYTGLMHPEFDVRKGPYNPLSSVVPVTRIEGYGYTLLAAAFGDRTISGQGSLVRFDGGFDSFEGNTIVFWNVDGYSGNKVGGSRARTGCYSRPPFLAHYQTRERPLADPQ
ncbi:MAG: hypothetical protein CM15mP125_3820 [Gammaproteobacteria bacterium]|nr:MAG: hypothetical protein CM15mP125_3820 [Gammaproteobacteria bacterium]